jgi:riboflavin synthase
MFTGIVAAIGQIERIETLTAVGQDAHNTGLRLHVTSGGLDLSDVKLGDSIAIQGACMTVTTLQSQGFTVDVSKESLNRTVGLAGLRPVNLEKSMRMGDAIGGHLVSGHVDGLGHVVQFESVGESWLLVVQAPASLGPFIAYKGSVAVNGVSLTVNTVEDAADGTQFSINLIPHTIAMTTLKQLKPGHAVNLEIDTIARYCERILAYGKKG